LCLLTSNTSASAFCSGDPHEEVNLLSFLSFFFPKTS